jgi:2'-5' RNA ligase
LTFKFLGEISEEKVKEATKSLKKIRLKKFRAKLGNLGVFTESFIKIIWIRLENCDALQKAIDDSVEDLFAKEKNFMSHLTIARVKDVKDKRKFLEELKYIKIKDMEFEVNSFKFKKSTLTEKGPIYENISEIKLT